MAGIADNTENNILNLIFRAVAWANYADNAAGTPQTNIHNALHTADPGDAGTMATSEAAYTSYARVNVARTTGGWTAASGGSISPAANIDFPESTGSGTTITFWSTGKTGGGAVDILWTGAVSPSIAVGAAGIIPRLTTASTISLT
jgi:hypothetical protein